MKKILLIYLIVIPSCSQPKPTIQVDWISNTNINETDIKKITFKCKKETYKVQKPVYSDCSFLHDYAAGSCVGQNNNSFYNYKNEKKELFELCMESQGLKKKETIIKPKKQSHNKIYEYFIN